MTELKSEQNDNGISDLKYSLFLGCVIPNRYPMIEKASRRVLKEFGIDIKEMVGASCCPAPGVFRSVDPTMWLTVGARNINIAQLNKADILTLCNGCYGTLLEVDHKMKHDKKVNAEINEVLAETGRYFDGSIDVKQIMEALYLDIGIDKIKSMVKRKLGFKVAVHYGCHLLKPSKIRPFKGEFEDPTFFDEVVEATGSESIDYREKFLCCGAGGGVRTGMKETSLQFTLAKLREVRKSGADCIVVSCPFCHLQYDLGQTEVKDMLDNGEEPFKIPVIYITQLIGLAMGLEPEDLGMVKPMEVPGTPFTSFEPLIKKIPKIEMEEQ